MDRNLSKICLRVTFLHEVGSVTPVIEAFSVIARDELPDVNGGLLDALLHILGDLPFQWSGKREVCRTGEVEVLSESVIRLLGFEETSECGRSVGEGWGIKGTMLPVQPGLTVLEHNNSERLVKPAIAPVEVVEDPVSQLGAIRRRGVIQGHRENGTVDDVQSFRILRVLEKLGSDLPRTPY